MPAMGATAAPVAVWLYGLTQDFTLLFVVLSLLAPGVVIAALMFPRDHENERTVPSE